MRAGAPCGAPGAAPRARPACLASAEAIGLCGAQRATGRGPSAARAARGGGAGHGARAADGHELLGLHRRSHVQRAPHGERTRCARDSALSGSGEREPCRGDLVHECAGARAGATPRRGGVSGTLRSRAAALSRSSTVRTPVRFGPERAPVGGRRRSRSIGSDEGHAPRRHAARAPRRRHRRRCRRGDRARAWRARRWPSSRTAQVRDLALPLHRRRAAGDRHRRSGQDALDLIRHDAAHVLAAAVMELYPGREDLDRPADRERLLLRLRVPRRRHALRRRLRGDRGEDARAHRRRRAVRRARTSRSREALERFRAEGQDYKVELIEDLVSKPTGVETVSLYTNGPFTDLCRGPHAPEHQAHRRRQAAVRRRRLLARRRRPGQMLTRVYGTAFFKQAELDAFLEQLEQARARDHRKLGRELGLFTFSPRLAGLDLLAAEGHRALQRLVGAQPRACSRSAATSRSRRRCSTTSQLWETSGHWGKYRENIFVAEYEDREFGLKPMNCPGHCHLFGLQQWSYRDLPVRYAEPGLLHRREPSGTLHGLLRVRHFIQDDAHIFCTEDQIQDEVAQCLDFAFDDLRAVRLPGARRALDAARRPHRRRRAVGPRRGRARRGAREQRHRVHDQRGRGRLLRARRSTCT